MACGLRIACRRSGEDSAKRGDAEACLDLRAGAARADTEGGTKSYGKTLPRNAVGSPWKRVVFFLGVAVTGGQRKKGRYYNEEKSLRRSGSACLFIKTGLVPKP